MAAPLMTGTGIGTALQVAMVVIGHFLPVDQQAWWFPAVGTLLGGVTGWLAAPAYSAPGAAGTGAAAGQGAVAGGIAGVLGSLVSTALGDVPVSNAVVAGGATVVSGAIGAALRAMRGAR
jgi:hypothetical protein